MLHRLAFSPDGKYLLSGPGGDYENGKYVHGEDFDVRVWKRDGTMLGQLIGHTEPLEAIRFSPSGNLVATAAWDHSLRFWLMWDGNGKAAGENSITLFDERQKMQQRQTLLAATYRQARAVVDAGKGGPKAMNGVLAPSIQLLPSIEVGRSGQQLQWQTVTMNNVGENFGAVRFKSPLDAPADLCWAFTAPSPIEWNIVPGEGEMTGFQTWQRVDDLVLPNLDIPTGHCVRFQSLPGGQIVPGQEYALWFSFPDSIPTPVSIALRLLPSGSAPVPHTADEIAKTIGLPVPLRYDASRFRVRRLPTKSEARPQPMPDRP
jgi:hypothetical protein